VIDRAVGMVAAGATATQAAAACGVAISSVCTACQRVGVRPPSKKRTHAIRMKATREYLAGQKERPRITIELPPGGSTLDPLPEPEPLTVGARVYNRITMAGVKGATPAPKAGKRVVIVLNDPTQPPTLAQRVALRAWYESSLAESSDSPHNSPDTGDAP
jgi:hypothetical protein